MKYFKYPLENNANPQRHSIQGPSLAGACLFIVAQHGRSAVHEKMEQTPACKISSNGFHQAICGGVTFLTIGGFLLTYASLEWLPPSIGYLLIVGMQVIVFVNAFVPHLVTTLRFRLYSPGVVTAVLITIPFSIYLFQRAFAEQILTWGQFWLMLGIAPFAMVLLAFTSLQVGRVFTGSE